MPNAASLKRRKNTRTRRRKRYTASPNDAIIRKGDTINVIGNIIRDENKIIEDKLEVINKQLALVLRLLIPEAEDLAQSPTPGRINSYSL